MDWVRGETIGYGSFATVSLATPTTKTSAQLPPMMAVKSCDTFSCDTLKNEKQILDQLGFCPQIIQCFGDDNTIEKGENLYNLLLEYASRGSLADHVKKSGVGLQESDVKTYTRSILKGLRYIHAKGFAHLDIKLQNILVCDNGEVKIADFGLAQKSGVHSTRIEYRGTPLYMAPETVNENEYDSPCDIWALGCAISEMVSGKTVWNHRKGWNICALLIKIGVSDELPGIPEELSEEGKDFLSKCFVKDPRQRWTAEMLLDHPFVSGGNDDADDDTVTLKGNGGEDLLLSKSPRGPFDFLEWDSIQSPETVPDSELWFDDQVANVCSPLDRIRQLVCDQRPDWSDSGSWAIVR